MKILGEKSLTSKVEHALEVIFVIIALIDFVVLGVFAVVTISEFSRQNITNILQPISLTVTLGILVLTGIVALYIIYCYLHFLWHLYF